MNALQSLTRYVGYLTGVTVALLVALVVYDATVRYLFQSGSIALQELEWHLFDVIILLGIAYALQTGSHVRVDIFYEGYREKTKAWVDLVSALFFILPFCALIFYVGCDFVLHSFEQMEGSSNPGGLPYRFLVKSLLPLGFFFLALQAVAEAMSAFKRIRSAA